MAPDLRGLHEVSSQTKLDASRDDRPASDILPSTTTLYLHVCTMLITSIPQSIKINVQFVEALLQPLETVESESRHSN